MELTDVRTTERRGAGMQLTAHLRQLEAESIAIIREVAKAGAAITLTLEDEVDIARSDKMVHLGRNCEVGREFDATLIWMSSQPLVAGKTYWLKLGPRQVAGEVQFVSHRDSSGRYQAADRGEIVNFPGVSAPYEEPRDADLVVPTDEWDVAKCLSIIQQTVEAKIATLGD